MVTLHIFYNRFDWDTILMIGTVYPNIPTIQQRDERIKLQFEVLANCSSQLVTELNFLIKMLFENGGIVYETLS